MTFEEFAADRLGAVVRFAAVLAASARWPRTSCRRS